MVHFFTGWVTANSVRFSARQHKGSFTRTVSIKLFIIVSMETGRLLAEWVRNPWVRNPFCKKTARLHSHNDKQLDGDGTCKRALNTMLNENDPFLNINKTG